MGTQEITQLISTVGFPIVAYLLMVFRQDKTINKLDESINNNTKMITLLLEREGVKND